ncbi:MAG: hypothetical protein LHW50_01460 [Candidatus Cloacimonetes bacterium]|nr:hypothetical protein [Candidatus Cloacimonadota bacterium]
MEKIDDAAAPVLPDSDLMEIEKEHFTIKEGKVYLIGSRSRSTGQTSYPACQYSYETGDTNVVSIEIGPFGKLYSFTSLMKKKEQEQRKWFGYIDFPCGARVFAPLQDNLTAAQLKCDMDVILKAKNDDWYAAVELDRD